MLLSAGSVAAERQNGSETSKSQISLIEVFPPIYPPLARQARISGDVKIVVMVRKDGSVASAEIASGHPMLRQAALESARKTKFLCQNCTDETAAFTLSYSFGFRDDADASCGYRRFRAAGCLYLWKCSEPRYVPHKQVIGESLDRVMVLAEPACVETDRNSSDR